MLSRIDQTLRELISGTEDAWEYFEGVPKRVVMDNLKAAVTKANRYDPTFQPTFDEYAAYRGFVIDAAVVRHATGKSKVERNVQYLRESFFRGEQWIDLEHVRRAALQCAVSINCRLGPFAAPADRNRGPGSGSPSRAAAIRAARRWARGWPSHPTPSSR